jgi:transposase
MPLTNKINGFEGQCFYVGIDVHLSSWSVTIRSLGLELKRFTQPANAQHLADYLKRHYPGGTYYSAYEAGFCGTSAHHCLKMSGIANIVFHAADLPMTDKQKKNKTDTHDSRAIASYLERHLLKGIYIMPADMQEFRSAYRQRETKVKDVVRYNNRIKSFLYYFGVIIPEEFDRKNSISLNMVKWLNTVKLTSAQGLLTLQQHVKDYMYLREQLLAITKRVKNGMIEGYPDIYKSLLSVPGFGPITAAAFQAEIGDWSRFDDRDEYISFLGITPREHSSGDTVNVTGMQPRCNKHLRPLLIEAAWQAIRRSPELLKYYRQHLNKNNKKAIVKVARKLALIARSVVINHSTYEEKYFELKNQKNANTPDKFLVL